MIARLNTWLAGIDGLLSARLRVTGRPGWRRSLAAALTHSGDALPFLAGLALLFVVGGPAWRVRVLALVLADTLTFLVTQTLKFLVRRARPEGEWGKMVRRIDPYSFPSGHSSRGGAMATMGLLIGPLWFGVLLATWGVLLALSRVALGVHYLSDALGGLLLGMMMALLIGLLVFV